MTTAQVIIVFADDLQLPQPFEPVERRWQSDFRVFRPVQQLKILDGIFDVDDTTGAVFHIDLSRLHEFTIGAPAGPVRLPSPMVGRRM